MLINYFNFLISFVIIFIITLGFGSITKYYLINSKIINKLTFGETGIIGFYTILFISLILHFFIPLNFYIQIIIFSFSLIFFIIFYKNIKIQIPKKLIIILIFIFIPIALTTKAHPDFEWYHLPYINYLNHYKIIFGLANSNDYLGYSQSWNDISGVFFSIISKNANNLIPIVFVFYIIIYFLEELVSSSKNIQKIFIYLTFIFLITKFTEGYEFAGHVPPTILGFLINYYFLKYFFNSSNEKKELITKILIFFSFILLLRINYIILFPGIVYLIFYNYRIIISIVSNRNIIFLLFLIPSTYFMKNFITSGCLNYPVSNTCFSNETINWSVGEKYSDERYNLIKSLLRGWDKYILLNGGIQDRSDYYAFMENNTIKKPEAYLDQGYRFWIPYWIQSGDVIKNLNTILIIFFSGLVIYFSSYKKIKLNYRYNINFLILFIIFFLQLLLWFFLTPQSIYGGNLVIPSFFIFIISYLLKNIKLNKFFLNIPILILLLTSVVYLEYKNINRIYKESNTVADFYDSFPLIKINENYLDRDYYRFLVNGFNLNIKKKIPGKKIELPDYCSNIPMLCLPEDRKYCIKNVYIKYNYIFLKGNELYCLDHLKKRYFY